MSARYMDKTKQVATLNLWRLTCFACVVAAFYDYNGERGVWCVAVLVCFLATDVLRSVWFAPDGRNDEAGSS